MDYSSGMNAQPANAKPAHRRNPIPPTVPQYRRRDGWTTSGGAVDREVEDSGGREQQHLDLKDRVGARDRCTRGKEENARCNAYNEAQRDSSSGGT